MKTQKPPSGNRPCGIPSRGGVCLRFALALMRDTAFLAAILFGWETSCAQEPADPAEPAAPVLHYSFDVRNGEKIKYDVGDRHRGRSIGALFTSGEAVGRALVVWKDQARFGYVETADHAELNSPKFTVAAWIKLRRK